MRNNIDIADMLNDIIITRAFKSTQNAIGMCMQGDEIQIHGM